MYANYLTKKNNIMKTISVIMATIFIVLPVLWTNLSRMPQIGSISLSFYEKKKIPSKEISIIELEKEFLEAKMMVQCIKEKTIELKKQGKL